jgi:hypothetical protein
MAGAAIVARPAPGDHLMLHRIEARCPDHHDVVVAINGAAGSP